VEVEREGSGELRLRMEDREATVEVLAVRDSEIHATLDGTPVRFGFAADGDELSVALDGAAHHLQRVPPPAVDETGSAGEAGAGEFVAPMPGTVVKVLVGEGDEVEEGQQLLVLEAMKTEHPVTAPYDGVVRSLPYAEGDLVPGGVVLLELEEKAVEAG
jgi:3-methylcrotonyl-CoA carboxylase alpha subunit